MAKKEKEAQAQGTGLSTDIDVGAILEKIKSGRGPKMPSKTTMNLVIKEKEGNGPNINIIIGIVVVIFLIVFGKFGVWDVYQKKVAAQAEVDEVTKTYEQNEAIIARYGKMMEKYSHYYYAFLTDDELKLVDRLELMDMLGSELFSQAAMQSCSIHENMVSITLNDVTLDQLGELAEKLSQNEMVTNVDVNTTSTYEEDGAGKLNKVISAAVIIEVHNDWLASNQTEEANNGEGAES